LKVQLLFRDTGVMKTPTSLEPRYNSLWRQYLTTHTRVLQRIQQQMDAADLPSLEWYDVLYTLKEAPDYRMRLSDLAEEVLLTRSNLTRLVDRLERAELLKREACPSDRRGTYAVLTEAGIAMQERMWKVYAEGIAAYFASAIPAEDVECFAAILMRLRSTAEQSDA